MTESWTILKLIEWISSYFETKGIRETRLNAEHLIANALELKRLDLYLQFDRPLNPEELKKIRESVERRAKREPLQHIIGTQPFRDIEVKVDRRTLIPRPETEEVVGEALKSIPTDEEFEILELGVGSGAILASIASEREKTKLTGTDICKDALGLAAENTDEYRDRIFLYNGDLFSPVEGRSFDMIISNPPYIAEKDWEELEPEVKDFEPKKALTAGEDGLDFYRSILNDATSYLNDGGWLILELGDKQSESVKKLAEETCSFENINIIKDLGSKDRIFKAQKAGR